MVVPGAEVFEALAAGLAVVWRLPGVDPHVHSEVILLTKFPSALITLQQNNLHHPVVLPQHRMMQNCKKR